MYFCMTRSISTGMLKVGIYLHEQQDGVGELFIPGTHFDSLFCGIVREMTFM
jgi:hypothetical protein